MSETANYKLYLTDSDQETFQSWREKMNGKNDSNMQKIDKALGEKADHNITLYATLQADAWTGVSSPFTQTLKIEGIRDAKEQDGYIGISQEATAEQRDIARYAVMSVIGQTEGELTVAADGEVPTQDIPVTIIIFR